MRVGRVGVVASALAAFVLVGCTGAEEEPAPSPEATTRPVEPSPADHLPDPVPEFSKTRTVEFSGVEVDVELGPLVREGDAAVLPVTIDAPDATSGIRLHMIFVSPFTWGIVPSAVRLVDPALRVVHTVAVDGGQAVGSPMERLRGEPVTVYAAFAAPEADEIDVLVPYVGYVEGVPVVDADDERAPQVPSVAELAGGASGLKFPVVSLDTYSEDLDGVVRTLRFSHQSCVR